MSLTPLPNSADPAEPLFIDDLPALRRFCQQLEGETILAIDTEFMSERTYAPALELVQLATRAGITAVVDCGALGSIDNNPLAPILQNPAILKVFHAAHQDLVVLAPVAGQSLSGIWDTQLVTELFAYTGGASYGAVVESLLGHRVAASQSLTDWSKRPLTPRQLQYAAEDVRHLIPLYDKQSKILQELGRLPWAEAECELLTTNVAQSIAARADRAALHETVNGAQRLDRRTLAILRELALWRDDEARRRNRPARSLLKDDILVQLARRAPRHSGQLEEFRAISPDQRRIIGPAIVDAVQRGKQLPEQDCPDLLEAEPMLNDDQTALTSLLSAVVQQLARRHGVSSTMLATKSELKSLVANYGQPNQPLPAVLRGWRGELAGRELEAIMNGATAVRWSPRAGSLVLEKIDKSS